MLYKNLFKPFQYSLFAAIIFMGMSPLAHATEASAEDKTPDTQKSGQPQQQATPAQPTVEPVDDDEDTYLV